MREDCLHGCFPYLEGLAVRVQTEDPLELGQLCNFLEAGNLCLRPPELPPRRQYKNCAYLAAAQLAVELQTGEPTTEMMKYYTKYFSPEED